MVNLVSIIEIPQNITGKKGKLFYGSCLSHSNNKFDLVVNCTSHAQIGINHLKSTGKCIRLNLIEFDPIMDLIHYHQVKSKAMSVINKYLEGGNKVLICCVGGKHRSPSLIVDYLYHYCNILPYKAINLLHRLTGHTEIMEDKTYNIYKLSILM